MVTHFLDWSRPLLPQVGERLLELGGAMAASDPLGGRAVELGSTVLVVPGRRAGRLVLHDVARRATADGRTLVPPRVLTPGDLVDAFVPSDAPRASALERRIAWRRALGLLDADAAGVLRPRAADEPPSAVDALAARLEALDAELVTHGRRMDDVAHACATLGRDDEAERWRALAQVEAAAYATLRAAGLVDPARDRRDRLSRFAFPADRMLVLAGIVELTAQQRAVVEAARDAGRLLVLVHAPATASERFDELGRPRPDAWQAATLAIDDADLVAADDPHDQAEAAFAALATLPDGHPRDDVAIVAADEDLARPLGAAAAVRGVALHAATGRTVAQTRPGRLLARVADWLDAPEHAALAALVRHPDADAALRTPASAPHAALPPDLAAALDAHWSATFDESPARDGAAGAIVAATERWLHDLADAAAEGAALGEGVLALLRGVYGALDADPDDPAERESVHAGRALARAADALVRLAPSLAERMSGAAAVRLVLEIAGDERVPSEAQRDAIETIGWLEAPFEPASAVVVLGLHEGTVPAGGTADPFLPDALRAAVGLPTDRDRAARDAYRLEALRRSRPWLRIVVGRRDASGDALTPSRLLLRCDDELLPSRVLLLATTPGDEAPAPRRLARVAWPASAAPSATGFRVPALPADLPLPAALRVTHFAHYLRCPYRFALEHLLRLKSVDDAAAELDPAGFGDLVHVALEAIGEEAVRDVDDEDELFAILERAVRATAATRWGRRPPPAVRLQVEQAIERLRGVARAEAAERRAGWRIRTVEFKIVDALLEIPDEAPMPVRGRVDRIDVHPELGVRVLDYKTGRSGLDPIKGHHGGPKARDRGEWIDLQLPLYKHLLPAIPEFRELVEGPVERDEIAAGYFAVADRAEQAGVQLAEWTPTEIDDAIEIAEEVVRSIRARRFPMSTEVDSPFDAFARICQVRVRGGDEAEEEDEA